MNKITQNFIDSIGGKPDKIYLVSTDCEYYNGQTFATFPIAVEFCKEVKNQGYKANVLDQKTGEVLYIA